MRRLSIVVGVLLASSVMLAAGAGAQGAPAPVGTLPKGRVTTITTRCNEPVAMALRNSPKPGRVWRIANTYDIMALWEAYDGNVGWYHVFIFVANQCNATTTIVFALTQGENGYKAYKARTYRVRSTRI
jgi:hypothetical protein